MLPPPPRPQGQGPGGPGPEFGQAHEVIAHSLVREVGSAGLSTLSECFSAVLHYVQQGPGSEGVGWLCFVGGFFTTIYSLFSLIDIFTALFHPLLYLLSIYFLLFGLMTCILEAPDEWQKRSKRLARVRTFIRENARFLTTKGGSGLFYLFQGSLWLSQEQGLSPELILGCYMGLLGLLNIAIQHGFDAAFIGGSHPTGRSQVDSYHPPTGEYINIT